MTEIPEHLLKRAAAARAAKSGGEPPTESGGGDDTPPAASAPGEAVAPAAATPARQQAPLPTLEAPAAPRVPDTPVIAAARNRKRVPYWAAPVLALLPVWGFIYVFAVQPAPQPETDALVIGKEIYAKQCQTCHQADGSGATTGGVGQQLNDGHSVQTFADPLAMVHWIEFGAAGGARDDGTYGDKDRPGGVENIATLAGQMPAFPSLEPQELASVVMYIRSEFGGDVYDASKEQGFTPETFKADPKAIEDEVTAVEALGETGDPDLSAIPRSK